MTTGDRIKAARKKAGMTQKELAEKLNIPYQSIGAWERNERKPKIETLYKISDAIGVTADNLLEIDLHQNWKESYLKYGRPFGDVPVEELEEFHDVVLRSSTVEEGQIKVKLKSLNPVGLQKAAELIDLLLEVPRYQKTPPQDKAQDGEEKEGG